ncbi:helix-turn-helix transcriptional regulator [Virgibacillus flavescens]|uniref:helix-turn-helix transcriptional regulator n=1 Tax=Virgibacillus flavescens TaxID=1611422 RepID=UPI003D343D69
MDQKNVIQILSSKIKLVRVEYNYTQDQMATVLGISKKTLVQIEKKRIKASWTTIVALCALFRESDTIQSVVGENVMECIETLAH